MNESKAQEKNGISLDVMFNPRSIAIIGASQDPIKLNGRTLSALVRGGFKGKVFPVNPRYSEIEGYKCYPSIGDIQDEVDLAVIAVPAEKAVAAVKECAQAGVRALIVFSSGFAEIGEKGVVLQEEMVGVLKKHGMLMCGPNCMGIVSEQSRMIANFAIADFPGRVLIPGFLGFITQSGGFGCGIYDMMKGRGIGFSHFISTGNEASLQFSDYMSYMVRDGHTKVIGGYMEGIKDGEKFIRAADMAVAAGKPVVIIKTGKNEEAAKAAASHTASLVGSDKVYNAVFHQKGIIRVENFLEFDAVLTLMACGKIPKGNRIGILATSGGAGVFLADKCVEHGLELAKLESSTRSSLDGLLPSYASSANPVDITAAFLDRPTLGYECASLILDDPNVDMLAICYGVAAELLQNQYSGFIDRISDLVRKTEKLVINLLWGSEDDVLAMVKYLQERMIPAVSEMETGIKALGSLVKYSSRRKSFSEGQLIPASVKTSKTAARKLVDSLPPGAKLTEFEAKKVIGSYGFPVARGELVNSEKKAVLAAESIGYPVAMKIESPDILHKTEAKGVKLNLNSRREVEGAYRGIMSSVREFKPQAEIRGVIVQEMLPAGVEIILGIGRDPVFGAVVMFGLGGIFVEALDDIAVRVPPLSRTDAFEMMAELKGHRVLEGLRGFAPVDKEALADVILKVSQFAIDFPQVSELDINPLICSAGTIKVADALMVIKN